MTRLLHILICLLVTCLLFPGSGLAAKNKVSKIKSVKKKPVFIEPTSATIRPLAVLNEMKHWSNLDYTRISLELDRDVTWESHELGKGTPGKPGRVYIDINHAKLGRNVRDITIGDGLLKGARVGQHKPDVVRVVLDTENIKDYKVFPLSEPARLIIDVRGERPTEISRLEQSISSSLEPLSELRPDERPTVIEKKPRTQKKPSISKIRRIVVDPGHGGHDPGAVGPSGLQEKDVVLSIGLKLRELLKDELGWM
jgi:N-acetylmuramoyl-L-alanine amidase